METSHTWRGIRTHGACGGTESRRWVWGRRRRAILTGVPLAGHVQASSFTCSIIGPSAGTWKRERAGPSRRSNRSEVFFRRAAKAGQEGSWRREHERTPDPESVQSGRVAGPRSPGAGDAGPAAAPPGARPPHPWSPSPSALGLQNVSNDGFFSLK